MENKQQKLFSEFPSITKEEWKKKIISDLKGGDYSKKMLWKQIDGIEVEPFYTIEDLEENLTIRSFPGEFPYIRGNKTDAKWDICQVVCAKDFEKANADALHAIERGATAIEFKLDFLQNDEDLYKLLKGIDILKVAVHFNGSYSYSILIELLKEYCEKYKIQTKEVKGSFNFDSFSYYLLKGEYYNSCDDNLNELKCLIELADEVFPNMKILSINAQYFHNAGSGIVQELAFAAASAHEYLVSLLKRGAKAEKILPKIRFIFATGSSYFAEIAKLRAFRMLWSQIASEYVQDKNLCKANIHSVSSLWNKSIYDSYNNILRTTTEAMSAILGGSDSVAILPYDIVYKQTDGFSERVARNIQFILKEESYFDNIIDPASGSFYIESLTTAIAQHTWDLFLKVEEMGGFVKAMEEGFIVKEIEQTARKKDKLIAERKTSIVGVNQYPNLNEAMLDKISLDYKKTAENENVLKIYRGPQAFEELRLCTESYVNNGGFRPKVYLAQYGNLAMRKARAQFASNFFGIVNFEIIDADPIQAIDWTVNDIIKSKTDVVVICSSDEEYPNLAPDLIKAIKNANHEIQVIIAGNPIDSIQMLTNAGVDDFIHLKVNALEFLKDFQQKLGINLFNNKNEIK
jgi:methylmalonyl-CoA mutase